MEKFRVLSDLHLDVNKNSQLTLDDKDVFTVVCGDTSGSPEMSVKWLTENCPNGVGVSGNHLPYNYDAQPIQKLREKLAAAFPEKSMFTYLDCETGVFSKEVDGILFVGTCMYTDMHVRHPTWNPTGDAEINMQCSAWRMNDYRWGLIQDCESGKLTPMTPKDYFGWFKNAYSKIEKLLNENETAETSKDVVLITHHPLVTDFFGHNGYVENADSIHNLRDFNYASYASDMKAWLKRHTSVKCHCCGHIHAVDAEFRHFDIVREDGSRILVVNNARGYVSRGHDWDFNPNTFVNVRDWTIETTPLSPDAIDEKKRRNAEYLKLISAFGF